MLRASSLLAVLALVASPCTAGGDPSAVPTPDPVAGAPSDEPAPETSPCPAAASLPAAGTAAADAVRVSAARCYLLHDRRGDVDGVLAPVLAATASADGDDDSSAVAGRSLLASYAALVAGEAKLEGGDFAAAAGLLDGLELPADSPAARRALLLRGRALVEADDLAGGRTTLNTLLSTSLAEPGTLGSPWGADPGEARWWLAEGAVRRGAPEAAVPVWQRLWTHSPTSPRADEAAARLAEAGRPVPDPDSASGRELILERVATLEKLNAHADALALRDRLPADGSEEQVRELAGAAFRARAYPRAVQLYGALVQPTADDLFSAALATSRTGDYERAAELYRRVVDGGDGIKGSSRVRDTASYKLGYLAYDGGDLPRALELFAEHLERHPGSRHADEARWFVGWSLVRLERWQEADAALGELVAAHPTSSLAAAGRYWRARVEGILGDADGERSGYEAVLQEDPETSYAWFAAAALGRTWDPLPDAPEPTAGEALASSPALVRGRALADAGLHGWARAELALLVGEAKAGGRQDALALGRALADAGAWSTARQLASPWCEDPADRDGDPVAMRLCWPRPHVVDVAAAARAGGLDPHLPFAIMKAESGWKPWVTSPAGARGIMQMMPALGGRWHEQLYPGTPYDPDRLYEAAYNSSLAIAELASLRDRLADSGVDPVLPLLIAAYNGGEPAVRRWLAGYETPPAADRFAEDIGYSETRRYVRRVLGTLQVYRYVYGDG